jgi:hypothetical protein
MLMGQQSTAIVILWVGFQVFWMIARIIVCHFSEPTDVISRRMLVERPWIALPAPMKTRVLELMVACAQYQTLVHPRGFSQYNGDSFTSSELASILVDTPFMKRYPLSCGGRRDRIAVNVRGVIGDTILASAAWITGSNELAPRDLYDCCIVSLTIESSLASSHQAVAVPAVRFFSGVPMTVPEVVLDVETQPTRQFIPKGAPNTGSGTWWYYVPCEKDLWLLIRRESPDTIIGKQDAEIVNDIEITTTLDRGNTNHQEIRGTLV